MPFWVIYLDNKGKLGRAGSYFSSLRAQQYADKMVHTKYWVIESKGRTWDAARNEVKYKLTEELKDAGYGTERIYKELD